jgi:hypothetical protein
VGRDPTAIKYYSRVASNLVGAGRLREFLLAAEGLRAASGDAGFEGRISRRLLSRGVAAALRDQGLPHVLEFLRDAGRVGIRAAVMLDADAYDTVAAACRLLLAERSMTEFVEAVEALARNVVAPNLHSFMFQLIDVPSLDWCSINRDLVLHCTTHQYQ